MTDQKIPFVRLYERRSKSSGLTYLSGKLGDLRLVAFRQTDTPEDQLYNADAVWQVYASPADQNYRERVDRGPQRPALASVTTARWQDK